MTSHHAIRAAIAARHALTPDGVEALATALAAGRGGGAQWRHPDLGGMGQWTRGGLLQIGDMFNDDLKVRVRGALDDLVGLETAADSDHRAGAPLTAPDKAPPASWWPADLGTPAATGSQNGMRYACFPDRRRLVVAMDGRTTVYDTGHHRLTGFAQAQGLTQRLSFNGPDGAVTMDELVAVG